MKIFETSKFSKLRKRIKERAEIEALKSAVLEIQKNPQTGKKLKGELKHLRSYAYTAKGQARRLVYKLEKDAVILFSFGPRQGIHK
jgi:mRNA-degrading endonuclease RelE of RelBE toxin-antitoxin system